MIIRDPGLHQWCMAGAWLSEAVILDGTTVTDICRGVLMNGERPVAVELYELNDRGQVFLGADGRIACQMVYGDVEVRSLRRVVASAGAVTRVSGFPPTAQDR